MKCFNCGAELTDDARFCSFCGVEITEDVPETVEQNEFIDETEYDEEPELDESTNPRSSQSTSAKTDPFTVETIGDKIKAKILAFWRRLDLFCKVSTVSIIVVALLLVISLCANKGFAIFFSVVQLAGIIVALLMHKKVIRLDASKKWIKYLVLIVAILLTALNIKSYSWKIGTSENTDRSRQSSASNSDRITNTVTVTKVKTPCGASECVGKDHSSVKSDFNKAGFSNIQVEPVEELSPDESDQCDKVVSISIAGKNSFASGEEFSKNDKVVIRYHAYKKCNVTVHVDFLSNLIFSTYDVKFLVNGVEKGTMPHGEDQDFQFTGDPGEYTLSFVSKDSSSVKGETVLTVDCDMEISYRISCYSDKVTVETLYIDRLTELAEGEAKLDVAASDYRYKNYEEVVNALESLGFTNIKFDIMYDIELGWTENGEVESVSIAGTNDFKRGDVFSSDAEVIIKYHMPKEDDPSNIKVPSDSSSYEGKNYLEVQQAFKDLNFTNIELGKVTMEADSLHADGEVMLVEIGGSSFKAGDVFSPDKKVYIKYVSIVEPEPNLTVENCPELAAILSSKAEGYDSYSAFAAKYRGRIIEFDGSIDYCVNHGNYNTRFDYLLCAGDYDPDHQIGPTFKFEDVNYYDLHTDLDIVSVGLNVRIVAEVVSFNSNTGLFYLDPVSVTGR